MYFGGACYSQLTLLFWDSFNLIHVATVSSTVDGHLGGFQYFTIMNGAFRKILILSAEAHAQDCF